jgi:hypothetical protein
MATGAAHGWTVHEYGGRWHWSAYGPGGGGQGVCQTREQAERAAQAQERAVSRPHGAQGFLRMDRMPSS